MSLVVVVILQLILCSAGGSGPANLKSEVSINCGSAEIHETVNGRRWFGDEQHAKRSDWLQMKGASTRSTSSQKSGGGDRAIRRTARISGSRFLYSIRLNPGQVILRLHFNPASYVGFTSLHDLFTVEAAQFTLLENFSASLTAQALGVNTLIKEFSISIGKSKPLIIVFTPSVSHTTYAFVNGIEIISVPAHLAYFRGQELGAYVVGENSMIYVGNSTALEIIHQFKVKQEEFSSQDEFDMFGKWGTASKQDADEMRNKTWKRSVHAGFRYLVRVHFSELGLVMAKSNNVMFEIVINRNIVQTRADIVNALIDHNDKANCWYRDYLVVVKGHKEDPQRNISIFLKSKNIIMDGYGLLQGFEILKLSNPDNSLASPNPLPPTEKAPCLFLCSLRSFTPLNYAAANQGIAFLVASVILLHVAARQFRGTNILVPNPGAKTVVQTQETDIVAEKSKPPASVARKGRTFSYEQIHDATDEFSSENIIGRGGFGIVFRGQIDNETVAIKRRCKSKADQGEKEFWAEVKTLSELRHINLVSLIGYCNEGGEMILVYEYMPNGTLEDHLFKHANGSDHFSPLTWNQRLHICIGAARGIDYLHTGNKVLHRDIKASNILLDGNFDAKVSDFGLARHEDRGNSQDIVSAEIKGTRGYMDPHYVQNCTPSRQSDIYAFGVVLLEVLSEMSVLRGGPEGQFLLEWVQTKIDSKEVEGLVAPCLRGEISKDSLNLFVEIAQKCVHKDPKERLTMARVVLQLESILAGDEQPKENIAGDKDAKKLKTNWSFYERLFPKGWRKKTSKGNETVPKTSSAPGCSTSNEPESSGTAVIVESNPSFRISLLELQEATNCFDNSQLIGVGVSGKVYKGVLNGLDVAVKRRNPRSQQSHAESSTVIERLCEIRHKHLVSLIGYCDEKDEDILVYEYMEKGSLKSHLKSLNPEHLPVLSWKERVEISIGAAQGLYHLHKCDSERPVIHGNVKSANILLDKNNIAKVADFGLSRMRYESAQTNVTTTATHEICSGIIDPDYFQRPQREPSKKQDIYWLGILLWEVCIGRRVDPCLPEDMEQLAKRTMKWHEKGQLDDHIDPDLIGKIDPRSLLAFGSAAVKCMAPRSGVDGPSLGHIIMDLNRALQFSHNDPAESSTNAISHL